MKYIRENHANRLELVRDFALLAASFAKIQWQLHGAAQGLKYLHDADLMHGDLKGVGVSLFRRLSFLTSNSRTSLCPTAPLLVPASQTSTSSLRSPTPTKSYLQVRKRRVARRGSSPQNSWSPRSLVGKTPFPRGKRTSTHLDWLYSRYASRVIDIGRSHAYLLQVLTGETPFRSVQIPALGHFVLRGMRPTKPDNSSTIGFSDPLWAIAQRCWDGKMELRPKVGEVVAHLREAAASWNGLMPPSSQAESEASGSEETSDLKYCGEFEILISCPPVLNIEQRRRENLPTVFERRQFISHLRVIHFSEQTGHRVSQMAASVIPESCC